MALATTTLSSAVALNDVTIVVASATSMSAGRIIEVDGERMQAIQSYVSGTTVGVLRGRDGSVTATHQASANVTHGLASDFANPPAGTAASVTVPSVLTFVQNSYSVAGAISFGAAQLTIATIIGTSTLAMTIASPTKDQDGQLLLVCGNAKSASTLTVNTGTAGVGNAGSSYDVLTAQNAGNLGILFVACNGFWNLVGAPITGTTTALSWAIA